MLLNYDHVNFLLLNSQIKSDIIKLKLTIVTLFRVFTQHLITAGYMVHVPACTRYVRGTQDAITGINTSNQPKVGKAIKYLIEQACFMLPLMKFQ